MLKFNIGPLLGKPPGTKAFFDIDDDSYLTSIDGLQSCGRAAGRVQLLKMPHEFNVQIKDLRAAAEGTCSRCLAKFSYQLNIPLVEREFIIDLPARDIGVGEDVFYVDKQTNEIDISQMVREELLLHFPAIPVCSESCKGLCDKCGINLNFQTCSCTHTTEAKISPFEFPK